MRFERKISRHCIFGLAALWLALNLLIPQIPVEKQISPFNGPRALHPFFNWHLFSILGEGDFTFRLKVESCKGQTFQRPMDAFREIRLANGVYLWPLTRRIDYIGNLFRLGKNERGHRLMQLVVSEGYSQLKGCRVALYSVHYPDPLYSPVETPMEESRFEL